MRLFALGRWCEGFMLGFAAGCSASGHPLPEDAREILADFARIAEVAADDVEDSEADYMEVTEYVRVGEEEEEEGNAKELKIFHEDRRGGKREGTEKKK